MNQEIQEKLNKIKSTQGIKKFLFKNLLKIQRCEDCGIDSVYNNKPLTLQLHHIDGNNSNNKIENFQILCPNCHSQTPSFRSKKLLLDEDILNACFESKTISEVVNKLKRYPSGHLYKRIECVIEQHNIPIQKYSYNGGIGEIKTKKEIRKDGKIYSKTCLLCNETYNTSHKDAKFCSYKCSAKASEIHSIDYELAIDYVKSYGWRKAATMLGVSPSSKTPDTLLRKKVKNYIQKNNLNIDFYNLSAHKKHSSKKDLLK
jgi:Zn finger protein HypA/HybF involved in hydrogenase expression